MSTNGQKIEAKLPNGQPVSVDYDSLSIAERASIVPAAWEHAQVHVRGGGHGIGNGVRVKVYNGPVAANRTTNGNTGPSTLTILVALIFAAFIIYAIATGGVQ